MNESSVVGQSPKNVQKAEDGPQVRLRGAGPRMNGRSSLVDEQSEWANPVRG